MRGERLIFHIVFRVLPLGGEKHGCIAVLIEKSPFLSNFPRYLSSISFVEIWIALILLMFF